ncbi:MAG: DNA replication/repair protein RecF [Woeseia sp.]
MPLLKFSCTDFRCLGAVEFQPHPSFSLICGANASGKTSLLEAVAYLGRGRSFRGASSRDLIRYGKSELLVRGEVEVADRLRRLGVRNGKAGLEISVDGDRDGGTAALAGVLPLQIIDPDVHELVGGSPDQRRRFIDWMTFHVERGYLDVWRRFRRALKQRNAVLKSGGSSLDSWDREFVKTALALHEARKKVLEEAIPVLEQEASALLGTGARFEYQIGWNEETGLAEQVLAGRSRDVTTGTTNAGPHRGDLRLRVDDRLAKRLVSRGQQKLLACAMVLGSLRVTSEALGRVPLLLLDDPAAELDRNSLDKLMSAVASLRGQVIATALSLEAVPLPADRALFHVEQGTLNPGEPP